MSDTRTNNSFYFLLFFFYFLFNLCFVPYYIKSVGYSIRIILDVLLCSWETVPLKIKLCIFDQLGWKKLCVEGLKVEKSGKDKCSTSDKYEQNSIV